MNHIVKRRVHKEESKLPVSALELALKEMENIENAFDFEHLCQISDIKQMKGTREPYYRLKFGDYRYMMYYDAETETLEILSLTHRKDSYKKHNLPWR